MADSKEKQEKKQKKEISKAYEKYASQFTPKPDYFGNGLKAFLIGGLICTIGEAGIHILTEYCGMDKKPASAWVSIALVAIRTG